MHEVRLQLSGRVQGVGMRMYLQRQALSLGLNGYARNLADGSVEVVAQGSQDKLRRFVQRARRGPRLAVVEAVQETWLEAQNPLLGFRIR